jgi:uncharacterized protein YndB with AHSA1/START domain
VEFPCGPRENDTLDGYGGHFRRRGRWRVPGGSCTRQHRARKFLEIDEPRRLVHTWGWEPGSLSKVAPGATIVEYELLPEGEHTILRLTNSALPNLDAVTEHTLGWEHYLGRLQIASAGGDAGRDPWLDETPS